MSTFLPFGEGDTRPAFQNLLDKYRQEIEGLENSYVLKASPTEIEDYYVQKCLINPLRLDTERLEVEDQQGVSIDVSRNFGYAGHGERVLVQGTELRLTMPFEGDPALWRMRPSTFRVGNYPEISVRDGSILFKIVFA